jgi:hypothetical protein
MCNAAGSRYVATLYVASGPDLPDADVAVRSGRPAAALGGLICGTRDV